LSFCFQVLVATEKIDKFVERKRTHENSSKTQAAVAVFKKDFWYWFSLEKDKGD